MMRDHEITTDGRTVWVTASDGSCIGRFGRLGVDVHLDVEGQLETGKQCLACIHGLPPSEAWPAFVEAMQEHYAIAVSDDYRPAYAMPAKAR